MGGEKKAALQVQNISAHEHMAVSEVPPRPDEKVKEAKTGEDRKKGKRAGSVREARSGMFKGKVRGAERLRSRKKKRCPKDKNRLEREE